MTTKVYIEFGKLARKKQIRPEKDHFIWMLLAGRGFGKTFTGAYNTVLYALRNPGVNCAVVAPTHGDLRRVCFSAMTQIIPDECLLQDGKQAGYASTVSEIRLHNGSKIIGFAAAEPDRLRGPQFHHAWCDELASWRYPEAFDQLMFGLRLGKDPKCVITTTPKPTKLIKALLDRDDCITTRGSTFENRDNLAGTTLKMLKERYEGTTLGRQELYAEVIDDVDGALWTPKMIEDSRVSEDTDVPLQRIVIAIDPAVTSNKDSDETGIIVAGRCFNNQYWVLEDLSGIHEADKWCRLSVRAFYEWEADRVIAEVNNGGDLVERLLRTIDTNVPYSSVRATRGKMVRAEPIQALFQQGKVNMVGFFPELESQMCSYTGSTNESPDRLDALVWALTELSRSSGKAVFRIG